MKMSKKVVIKEEVVRAWIRNLLFSGTKQSKSATTEGTQVSQKAKEK